MTADHEALRGALLTLGLEDQIPLPEAIEALEVRAAADPEAPITDVARALRELAAERRIVFFRGRWDDDEPPELPMPEAAQLLGDERWYQWRADDPDAERLYFMNVDNLVER